MRTERVNKWPNSMIDIYIYGGGGGDDDDDDDDDDEIWGFYMVLGTNNKFCLMQH